MLLKIRRKGESTDLCFHIVFRRTFKICLLKYEVKYEDEGEYVEEEKEDENKE